MSPHIQATNIAVIMIDY